MRFIAVMLLALLLPVSAIAATPETSQPSTLDAKSQADVQAIEAYLNTINTLKSHFVQTTGDGKQVTGEFLLRRPGRMRFQYDPPVKDFIVADGMFIHYYDNAMKQGSRTLISKSLADFFLRKDLTLEGDLKVSKVSRDGKLLMVTLVEKQDQNAGSLTLGFVEKPALALKKWRIVDPQNVITEVELFDVETGIQLDRDIFRYYDPEHTKEKFN